MAILEHERALAESSFNYTFEDSEPHVFTREHDDCGKHDKSGNQVGSYDTAVDICQRVIVYEGDIARITEVLLATADVSIYDSNASIDELEAPQSRPSTEVGVFELAFKKTFNAVLGMRGSIDRIEVSPSSPEAYIAIESAGQPDGWQKEFSRYAENQTTTDYDQAIDWLADDGRIIVCFNRLTAEHAAKAQKESIDAPLVGGVALSSSLSIAASPEIN